MYPPLCSVIIRSFNEQKHIGKLIDGLQKQTLFDELEIILVDSGSTDNTVKIAKEKGASIVRIRPEEFSFGRALNIGCAKAKGEFLLFASAHVYPVYNTWIEKMLQPFESEKVGLVYGRQIGNEVTKYSEHQIFKKWFPKESNFNQPHPFCNNANAVIRKSFWERQPFDENLTGLEDLDWATKIQQTGYHIAYQADAPIVHVHEEPVSKIKNRYRREAIALHRIVPEQTFSLFDFVRLATANIISDSFHALHDRVFWESFRSIVLFRSMQFWGTYRGFNTKGDITAQLRQRFYYPNNLKRKQATQPEPGEKINYHEYKVQS
jgi:rhamnosyltransferase